MDGLVPSLTHRLKHRVKRWLKRGIPRYCCLLLLPVLSLKALGHGGVALTDDVCVISIGNLAAHFAIYQPDTRGNKEFCEDFPDTGRGKFVIDFIHTVLGDMEIDFRIVRDRYGVGLAATWEDYQAIANTGLAESTRFYRAPNRYPQQSMVIEHDFEEKGHYIGVITARHPNSDKTYHAVFPFRVGKKTFFDYLPYFIGLLLLVEYFYWKSNRQSRHEHADKSINQTIKQSM